MKEKIRKLEKLISKSEKILLLTHTKLDGDAIGSLGTFYLILEKIGKKTKSTNDLLPDRFLEFLGVNKIFEENLNLKKFNPDLMICLDIASINQLGNIYTENADFFKGKELVVIDHHLSNTKFGTLNIIDKESSSTCELMFYLIKKLGYGKYLSKKCINLLLAGIVTDTNIFYNQNTTPNTLSIASRLLELGGDLNKIIYNFYYKISFNKLKLKGILYEKIQTNKDKDIIWLSITQEDFEKTETTVDDTSGIINDLINIEGCKIAFLLYPLQGKIKVSFRSNDLDTLALASSFDGGGGHKLASGFKSTKKASVLEKEILKKIKSLY